MNKATESSNETPLSAAATNGHLETVQMLISKGASLEHRDKKVGYIEIAPIWNDQIQHLLFGFGKFYVDYMNEQAMNCAQFALAYFFIRLEK